MKSLPRLEYAITRPFPWKRYTESVVIVSFFVLLILTVINFAAVGYEVAPFTSIDINYQQNLWWSRFVKNVTKCERKLFTPGDQFQTYTGYPIPNTFARTAMLPYDGSSLKSACILPRLEDPKMLFVMHRSSQTAVEIESLAKFWCEFPVDFEGKAWGFNLTTQYSFSSTGISSFPSESTGSHSNASSVGSDLAGVLDILGRDIARSIAETDFNESSSIETITTSRTVGCDQGDWNVCVERPLLLNKTDGTAVDVRNGSHLSAIDAVGLIPDSMNGAMDNFLLAWASMTRADLGYWSNGSIFVAQGMLNQTISAAGGVGAQSLRNGTEFSSSLPFLADKIPQSRRSTLVKVGI
ncbi:hypothetical protein DL96DRAFT_1716084 [Flagelloscypha sp. PMI_526]|nr:hypothetical protein DL96DRAFT_1716084 [Flagelloscypha sp. PMI_526]